MLDTLQCPSQICRENQRLVLMYKIVHGLVALPSNKLIPADGRTKSNHSSLTQVQDHQFTSSRSSVHRHQSTRIPSFFILYQPGTLCHALQSTATPWTLTQRGISQLESLPITCPDTDDGCKGKGLDTCYSAAYMSQTRDQQRFTISEVAANWHKPMVPQRIMWPSIARANRQLDPRCS